MRTKRGWERERKKGAHVKRACCSLSVTRVFCPRPFICIFHDCLWMKRRVGKGSREEKVPRADERLTRPIRVVRFNMKWRGKEIDGEMFARCSNLEKRRSQSTHLWSRLTFCRHSLSPSFLSSFALSLSPCFPPTSALSCRPFQVRSSFSWRDLSPVSAMVMTTSSIHPPTTSDLTLRVHCLPLCINSNTAIRHAVNAKSPFRSLFSIPAISNLWTAHESRHQDSKWSSLDVIHQFSSPWKEMLQLQPFRVDWYWKNSKGK